MCSKNKKGKLINTQAYGSYSTKQTIDIYTHHIQWYSAYVVYWLLYLNKYRDNGYGCQRMRMFSQLSWANAWALTAWTFSASDHSYATTSEKIKEVRLKCQCLLSFYKYHHDNWQQSWWNEYLHAFGARPGYFGANFINRHEIWGPLPNNPIINTGLWVGGISMGNLWGRARILLGWVGSRRGPSVTVWQGLCEYDVYCS